jgi:O-antigen/teichoic acid export membrane protein
MARRFLTEFDNGLYGALSTVAKSSIFLVHTINFVTFPKFALHRDSMQASRRIMYKSLVLGSATTCALFVLILVFPESIIEILTHSKYLDAVPYLKYFFLAFMPYPFIFIFINYFIVHRDWRFTFTLTASLFLLFLAYESFHSSINEILLVLGGAGYTLFIASGI